MRASRWPLAAFLVGAMVVVVSAQQPGGGRGGFRQSAAQMLLTNTALQEELKLSDTQKEKLKGLAEKQQAAAKERFGAFKDAGGDKDKLKAMFAELQKENEARQKEAEALLNADQKTRLHQIDRQLAGVRAFTDDMLVSDLKLNDTQKTKIKGIVDEYNKDVQGLGGFGGFGKGGFDKEKAAEAQKKREKLAKGAMADIDEVLTADQRKTWKDLTGEPIDAAKIRQAGFGGFGGFGGNKGGFRNKNKTKD